MSETVTEALSCWRVRQNRTNSASKYSETNRGRRECRSLRRKVDESIHKSCLETMTPSDQRLGSVRRLSRMSAVRWRESQGFCKHAYAECRNANPRYGARSIRWFELRICPGGSAMQVCRPRVVGGTGLDILAELSSPFWTNG
jgi:hypothetical protein